MFDKLLGKVPHKLFFDRHDLAKAAIISGSGRSGTTWVGQVLGSISHYRLMFEPFHCRETRVIHDWHWRQYVRPDDQRSTYVDPASLILSGRVHSHWIDRLNGEVFPRGRLIKDIRIQLLLPWMHKTFPEIPIAIVTRHPCAVALSRMALGWQTSLDTFLQQEELVDDYLSPFVAEMERAEDEFDKNLILWCAENYVPMRYFSRRDTASPAPAPGNPVYIARYEDICADPEAGFARLADYFGWRISEESKALMKRPSAMTAKHSAILSGGNPGESWRNKITDRQRASARRLLETFQLTHLYSV
ncbi:sulfotransferase [Dongia sp. agr-C8]